MQLHIPTNQPEAFPMAKKHCIDPDKTPNEEEQEELDEPLFPLPDLDMELREGLDEEPEEGE
jgi:hypothetical protein